MSSDQIALELVVRLGFFLLAAAALYALYRMLRRK